MAHDFLRDVADDQTLDAGAAMGRQHNQIGEEVLRAIEDSFKGIAIAHVVTDLRPLLHSVVAKLLEQHFRVFLSGLEHLGATLWLARVGLDQRRIGLGDLGQIVSSTGWNHVPDIERPRRALGDLHRQA